MPKMFPYVQVEQRQVDTLIGDLPRDRDIGPRVGRHPKSVSRIVQRELRKHGESK